MTLAEYLAQPGQTAAKLALDCGVAVSTISRAARGEAMPSRELMRAIFEKTGGAVTPNSIVGVEAA